MTAFRRSASHTRRFMPFLTLPSRKPGADWHQTVLTAPLSLDPIKITVKAGRDLSRVQTGNSARRQQMSGGGPAIVSTVTRSAGAPPGPR